MELWTLWASTKITGSPCWTKCVFQYTDNCGHLNIWRGAISVDISLLLIWLIESHKRYLKAHPGMVLYYAWWRVLHVHQYVHQEIIRMRCYRYSHTFTSCSFLVRWCSWRGTWRRHVPPHWKVVLYPQVPPLKISEVKVNTKTEKMIMTFAVFLKYDIVLWVLYVLYTCTVYAHEILVPHCKIIPSYTTVLAPKLRYWWVECLWIFPKLWRQAGIV